MKSLIAFLVLTPLATAVSSCNADDCARAITGTVKGPAYFSSAKTACSNFLKAIVYPATVTKSASATIFPSSNTRTSTIATATKNSTVYPFTATSFVTIATDTQTTLVSTATVTQSTETDFATISTSTLFQKGAIENG